MTLAYITITTADIALERNGLKTVKKNAAVNSWKSHDEKICRIRQAVARKNMFINMLYKKHPQAKGWKLSDDEALEFLKFMRGESSKYDELI